MKKIILVDGNNLLFRSYYATSYSGVIMRNSKGFPTNGLYGFINMMNKIIDEEKPNYILVAFDKGKTFRHDQYDSYKAGRKAMPEDLKLQFPKAKEVLDTMGIKHFEIDNYEADDIIGTMAKIIDEEDQFIATIVSSDKDLLQLISDEVDVKLLKTKDYIRFNKEVFRDHYKIDPINMIDLKALMGDSSDNIPGVKGIGEKGAVGLLSKYHTLDNLYNHLDEVTPKTREKLINDKESAYMSYDLATIYRNVPIPFSLDDCRYLGINYNEYLQVLEELEFKSLIKKLEQKMANLSLKNEDEKGIKNEVRQQTVDVNQFDFKNDFAFYIETDNLDYNAANIMGLSFVNDSSCCYIPFSELINYQKVFSDKTIKKYTYDVKKGYILLKKQGINLVNCNYDAMIAAYLLDYNLSDDITILMQEFNYDIPTHTDFFGTVKRRKEIDNLCLKNYVLEKGKFIYNTKDQLLTRIKEEEEEELFNEIEMPLAYVLSDMELTGVKVNKDYLLKLKDDLEDKLEKMEQDIYKEAGCEFNIMSFKQLGDVLFVKLELPYPKKRKKDEVSYSTNKDILDKIKDYHPIVPMVLEYRMLSKLYANYVVGLIQEIDDDGRIHTVFNQCLTRTGRLSSNKPNLQNIPIRSDYTRLVRKAFVPFDDESVMMSSDYSQIELRIFASLSNATNLIQAFKDDKDIHTKTAADIFHVNLSEVNKSMRRTAKAVNFGILYGISSFGLSEDLKIDLKSAKNFIDNYLETYPGIKEYMEEEKKEAYKNGYVKTIMNRKRIINELKSSNYMVRSGGERMALNTPIQGSAADILKKATVALHSEMTKRKLKSKILIQVHDELVLNVYKDELAEVKELVKDKMENVVTLQVPLKVDIEVGNNWYEAK